MKRNILVAMVTLATAICCTQNKNKEQQETSAPDTTPTIQTEPQRPQSSAHAFDINSIKQAKNIEGDFPYFKLPEGYTYTDPNKYHGKGEIKDVDKEYFYNHGRYFPMEGKSFKAVIRVDDEKFKDKKFSTLEIQKSFDDFIANIGGEKINNGEPLQSGESDRLKSIDNNALSNGYQHSCNNVDNVHTYVIRTKNKTIFVQYNLGAENANITILEPKAFENKMEIIPSTEIQKQLDEKGKAVLYINFDTDKATLKPDGKQSIKEIEKLLSDNKELKLSIEGHTDNTGEAKHNKELSKQRATTVFNELISAGIPAGRLQVKGFGSENPLVPNNIESNKAKNRRVELVKI